MPDYHAKRGFEELLADRNGIFERPYYQAQVEAIVDAVVKALQDDKKVYWCGNGGSAAEAQHMAAELSGRYLRERPGYASEALSVNTSTLTCIGNDYGYDHIFSRQVLAFAQPGDVVIGLTTSSVAAIVLALEPRAKGAIASRSPVTAGHVAGSPTTCCSAPTAMRIIKRSTSDGASSAIRTAHHVRGRCA